MLCGLCVCAESVGIGAFAKLTKAPEIRLEFGRSHENFRAEGRMKKALAIFAGIRYYAEVKRKRTPKRRAVTRRTTANIRNMGIVYPFPDAIARGNLEFRVVSRMEAR